MSHWQLPWRGPVRRVDRGGQTTGWDVMAAPSLGEAMVVGVAVIYNRNGHPRLVVQTGLPQALQWKTARVGEWTTVPVAAPGQTVIYLMKYDQVPDIPDSTFSDKGLQPRQLQWYGQVMAEINAVLEELADLHGESIEDFLFMDDAMFDARRLFGAPPADSVTVAFGSCQYPAGMFDRALAEHSWRRLSSHLRSTVTVHPECLLLLGDQIYADATAGLLDPLKSDDRYNTPHEDFLRIPGVRDVMRRIPVHMMLDDHEIQDNWEPFRPRLKGTRLEQGLDAYWRYQRGQAHPPARYDTWFKLDGPHWCAFMADSRTLREYRSASRPGEALILGSAQTADLETWLLSGDNAGKLKLVCSPAMLLPRHVEHQAEPDYLDNWDGYPGSLVRMLSFVFDNRLSDVCFLSGDAHLGCDAHITVSCGPDKVMFRSIHTTSLYAPFPFANEREANLKLDDEFSFSMAGRTYNVKVQATAAPDRDGWTLLRAGRDPVTGEWDIQASTM
ncbi:MAG: alkaline phosphatase D family protein [Rhodoferax sp.]|nr:alkaline phosphatase D family protein [Rhodoferax sp.]